MTKTPEHRCSYEDTPADSQGQLVMQKPPTLYRCFCSRCALTLPSPISSLCLLEQKNALMLGEIEEGREGWTGLRWLVMWLSSLLESGDGCSVGSLSLSPCGDCSRTKLFS